MRFGFKMTYENKVTQAIFPDKIHKLLVVYLSIVLYTNLVLWFNALHLKHNVSFILFLK